MSNHARAEVERDDKGQRLVRAAREHSLLVRDESETDVCRQPKGANRDDISEDRGEAMADVALMSPAMDNPSGRRAEDIAPQDFEDRNERGWDAL